MLLHTFTYPFVVFLFPLKMAWVYIDTEYGQISHKSHIFIAILAHHGSFQLFMFLDIFIVGLLISWSYFYFDCTFTSRYILLIWIQLPQGGFILHMDCSYFFIRYARIFYMKFCCTPWMACPLLKVEPLPEISWTLFQCC